MTTRPRAGVCCQKIIVCVTAVCTAAGCHLGHVPSSVPVSTSRPPSFVAAIGDRLAVLSSMGSEASYLPGRFAGINSLAVTADGRSIIIGPSDCEKDWIQRVDRLTGAIEDLVGGAEYPVVNAKGLVAYAIRCDGRGILGTTDIVTGQNSRRSPLGESDLAQSVPIESVRPLGWSSQGRTLFYVVTIRGEARARYYFGLLWPIVDPSEEVIRRVVLPDDALAVLTAVALVDDSTIVFAQNEPSGSWVREWDVMGEHFTHAERSFMVPETVVALTSDASGRQFLAVTRSHVLYHWSVGDRAPAILAANVNAAAWLP